VKAHIVVVACLFIAGTVLPAIGEETELPTDEAPNAAQISWSGSGLLTARAATTTRLPFETVGPPAIPGNPVRQIIPGNPVKIIRPGFGELTSSAAE
jgi:hypothetical protein